MKKFLSLVLSLVLALALAVPSYAAEPAAQAKTVGVIVDGERIPFSGAAPELWSGNTMVPLKALVEAMGGQVTVQSGTLLCTFDGGVTVQIRPDSDSYYKNGYTYVPVRDLAEPLGYDVFWDSGEQAAVLIDRQAIIDRIDQQFTILNGALTQLQKAQDPGKNYKTQMDYVLSVDALDEISGEKTQVDIDLTATVLTSADAIELELHADVSSLGALILSDLAKNGYITDIQAAAISTALKDLTLEGRYDLATGDLYFRFPALAQLNELTGWTANRDDWYHLTLPAMSSLADLGGVWLDTLGIPQDLLEQIQSGELNSIGGIIYFYSVLLSQTPSQISSNAEMAGQVLAQLFGDDNFQTSGTTQKLHIGTEDLEALMGQEGLLDEMFKTLGLDLTVRQDGSLSVALALAFQEAYLDGDSASVEGNLELSGDKVEVELILHLSDLINAQYNLTETIRETSDKPQTAPPAGANVVELGNFGSVFGISGQPLPNLTAA